MGSELKDPRRVKDATKPWRQQFFPCEEKTPEPAFNRSGFWKKPEHGLPLKGEGKNARF